MLERLVAGVADAAVHLPLLDLLALAITYLPPHPRLLVVNSPGNSEKEITINERRSRDIPV